LHNPNVLVCTISDMSLENSGVMLPKFCLDMNQAFCHKHSPSVTPGWV
jgi:hypothetical protein